MNLFSRFRNRLIFEKTFSTKIKKKFIRRLNDFENAKRSLRKENVTALRKLFYISFLARAHKIDTFNTYFVIKSARNAKFGAVLALFNEKRA